MTARPAVEELVATHRKWALGVAGKLCRQLGRSTTWDQALESAALFGLWQAAQRWDGRGSFKGWATARVRGAVVDEWREVSGQRRAKLTCEVCSGGGCAECGGTGRMRWRTVGLDAVAEVAAPIEDTEDDEALALVLYLPERERNIMRRRLTGETALDIADDLGVHNSRISQITKRAGEHLRELAVEHGFVERAA